MRNELLKEVRMRKALVVLLIAAFAISAFAAEIHYGVTGGLNLSNFTGEDADDFAMKLGFNVGAMLDIELFSVLSFQPELLYTMKGANADTGDGSLALNYLEIPILLKVTPVSNDKMDISVFAGPFVAMKLSEKITDSDGDELDLDEDRYTSMDMGLNFGAGVTMPFAGETKLGLQAGYEMGVTNVLDIDDWDDSWGPEPEAKTTNIFLSAIIFFN